VIARLTATALDHWWELDGYAAAHNLPELGELPLPRFLAFVYYMLTRNLDENELAKLRARLWRPPPGEVVTDPRSPWAPQNEAAAFAAFKAQATGTVRPSQSRPK